MQYDTEDIRLAQRLLRIAITEKSADKHPHYKQLLKQYYQNDTIRELTHLLAHEMGLDVISVMHSNRLLLMPSDQDSPFSMRLGDIDKMLDADPRRRAATALVMMGVACAFFIDQDEDSMRNIRLTRMDILDSIRDLCQKIADTEGEDALPGLYKSGYHELLSIDSATIETRDASSLSGILNKVLDYLIEEKFIIEEGSPPICTASEHYIESLKEHGIPDLYEFAQKNAIGHNRLKERHVQN